MASSQAAPFDPKNMPYRRLGRSGLLVPVFSIGSWLTVGGTVKGDPAKELLRLAYDAGINYIDTAEVYSKGQSEIELGRIIKELGWKRDEITIATKLYFGTGRKAPNTRGLSRKHIIEGMAASLERLQLDHVDVVHAHRDDPEVPMLEIVEAFTQLVRAGKTFYWGTSMWSAARLLEAYEVAERYNLVPPTAEQPQYHLMYRRKMEEEYKPVFDRHGLGTTTWSPLASGLLTGKYNDGVPGDSRFATNADFFSDSRKKLESPEGKAEIEKVKKLTKIAERLGVTTATLALAWVAAQPNVSTVILGVTKPAQLEENLKAIDVLAKLGKDEATLKEIDELFAVQ